jgi:excisionase family DNA binding protein
MKSLSELFEFLKNCDKEALFNELNTHCDHLIQKNGTKSIRPFKIDVENLNTLFRLSEWFLEHELPRMIEDKFPSNESDEILTVEGAALYMKVTPAHVYKLLDKGKLKGCSISATDKPGVREVKRIRKSEVDRFLEKR